MGVICYVAGASIDTEVGLRSRVNCPFNYTLLFLSVAQFPLLTSVAASHMTHVF